MVAGRPHANRSCWSQANSPQGTRTREFALTRDDSTTYRQDMEAWNARVQADWRFSDWRNFRSAALAAVDAVNRPARGCE